MKRFLTIAIVLTLLAVSNQTAYADIAVNKNFKTAVSFQNADSATAQIKILYYPDSGANPTQYVYGNLAPNASAFVMADTIGVPVSGKGAFVVVSDKHVVATTLQIPETGGSAPLVKNRPASNGFSDSNVWNSVPFNILLATVLKATFNTTSRFQVQNVDVDPVTIVVTFKPIPGGGTATTATRANVLPGASVVFDMATISELSSQATFNGSATIHAENALAQTRRIVATSVEYSTNSTPVYAFESVPDYETQSIIYMPSALCNYPTAATPQSTFYGIQNTSSSLYANVTVGYYDLNGTLVGQQSNSIAPSDKWSHSTCSTTGLPANFSGSAVIQSSNSVFLAAVGKVTGSGVSSGFMAQATGSSTLYLPYQRYASDTNWLNGTRHRTFNAIQNIGGSLLANAICTTFYDAAGVQAGSQVCNSTVLNQYQKYNPHPSSAGLTNDWGYGASEYGSAVVRCPTCSSNQLISVTRVTSYIDASTSAAEDYVGLK